MIIIGVDFHPEFQQIAWVDTDTGGSRKSECSIRRKRRSSIVLWRLRVRIGELPKGRCPHIRRCAASADSRKALDATIAREHYRFVLSYQISKFEV